MPDRSIEQRVYELERNVSTHEAVCAERYGVVRSRVGRLEALAWATLSSVLAALFVTVIYLLRIKLGL